MMLAQIYVQCCFANPGEGGIHGVLDRDDERDH
jgi:hypothetical protein